MNLQDFNDELVITKISPPKNVAQDFTWEFRNQHVDQYSHIDVDKLDLNGKKYIPAAKDRLYFFPGCDVPRYKVRDWAKKNNASVTINIDTANILVGVPNTVYKCLSHRDLTKVPTKSVLQWLNANYNMNDVNIKNLEVELTKHQGTFVYLSLENQTNNSYWLKYSLDYQNNFSDDAKKLGFKSGKGLMEIAKGQVGASNRWNSVYLTDNNLKIIQAIQAKPDVYPQESIIGVINADSPTIDQDMYRRLRDMFNSSNTGDHVLALELMSN